jgi:hypothetical protein
VTPETADHYGPVIDHMGFVTANVAGCIELTDYPSGLACAKSVQAANGCELAACEANCPVHDMASRAGYDACAKQAAQVGCQYYDAMATRYCNAERDAGQAAICLFPMFQEFYNAVVPLFCGPPPVRADAGLSLDAGGDASGWDVATDGSQPSADGSGDALPGAEADAPVDAPRD